MVGMAASSRSLVEPFLAMDVMVEAGRREHQGQHVWHMEVGEPGHRAPLIVRDAAKAALDSGLVGYTPALGLTQLRDRIARHYHETYGVDVPPSRVAVTTGSSAGFILSFLSCFDVGDRVALPSPGYPAYRNVLKALGLEPVDIPVYAEDRYVITPDALLARHAQMPVQGVLVASPANPNGTMMLPESFQALVETCDAAGIRFLSDEIYHGLVYEGEAATALQFTERAVILNSFSKYYCMTGWRIGWMVLPEDLVRPVERLSQSLYISAPFLSQVAAEKAFDATDELDAIRAQYATNRSKLLHALPEIGFTGIHPVDGAFYIYADARQFTNDALEFSKEMLASSGVAATPGVDFDPSAGTTMMRFSFAGDEATIDGAIVALKAWLLDGSTG